MNTTRDKVSAAIAAAVLIGIASTAFAADEGAAMGLVHKFFSLLNDQPALFIALALANHRRWESENVGRMLAVGGSVRRRRLGFGRRERVVVG